MTYAYRFVIAGTGIDFVAPGQLQKAEGCYLVNVQCSYDQALALLQHASAQTPITLWVEVGGDGVAFMHVHKVWGREKHGQFVEVACLVHVPDAFAEARRT